MSSEERIPVQQVERILETIETVMGTIAAEPVSRDLIERVVRLEVEFQYVDDREKVQKRIEQIVDEYVDGYEGPSASKYSGSGSA